MGTRYLTAFGPASNARKRTLEDVELEASRLVVRTSDSTAGGMASRGANVRARDSAHAMTAMEVAVRRGLRAVNALLARGANPNERFVGRGTALHVAARLGRDEIVQALLISGGNGDALDSRGESPLIKAVRFGHERVAAILIKVGCDVGIRARGPRCFSALDRAAENG